MQFPPPREETTHGNHRRRSDAVPGRIAGDRGEALRSQAQARGGSGGGPGESLRRATDGRRAVGSAADADRAPAALEGHAARGGDHRRGAPAGVPQRRGGCGHAGDLPEPVRLPDRGSDQGGSGRLRMRLTRVAHIVLVAVAGLVAFAPASAGAGAPTDQLKASVEQILKVLEDPALKAEARAKDRRAAIRKEAEGVFDFTETAKRALGRHWQSLSEKDREEFTGLFTDLIERAYISKIERYSGERIAYAGEAIDGGLATVRTRFVTIIQTSSYAELVRKMKAAELGAPASPRS